MGALFLLLAIAVTVVALHPGWRKRVHWGRGGTGTPLTVVGWSAWIGALYAIAAARFGLIDPRWILLAVTLVFAAGVFDSLNAPEAAPRRWVRAGGWLAFAILLGIAAALGWVAASA